MSSKSKYKDLSKNTLLFTISSFGAKIISFLLVPLYTYVLSTQDYGLVDLMTTTVQLLIPILTINIQDAVLRYALDKDYDEGVVVGAGIKIIVFSSIFLGLILLVVGKFYLIHLDGQYLMFLFFSYVFGALNNCFSMYLKARDKVKVLTVSGLINTFLACILNIVLLLWLKMGVTGYLVANVAGTIIAVLYMLVAGKIFKETKFKNTFMVLNKMIPYSMPLVANSLAWWLNNASDRYILTFFCGAAVNGIYAVSYKIPTILSTIQSVFYSAWSISAITEFDKDDSDGFIGNVYSLYSAASYIGCSILLIGNVFIAKILYSNDFFVAWKYVPFLLVGTVFNGIALFEGCIFTAVKRTKDVSRTTIMGALVNTIINFLLIPFIGATGAALSTMIGYMTVWIIRTLQLRSIVKMKVDWNIQIASAVLILIQAVFAVFVKSYLIQAIPIIILIVIQRKIFVKVYHFAVKRFRK
mgnify:FL=1